MDLIKRVWELSFNSDPFRSGYLWFIWNVIASLLPLWGTAFLFWIFGKHISLYDTLKHGEFVLYSAAFVGGAMYVNRRDIFPSRNTVNILLFLLLIISLMVFVAITVLSVGNNPEWLKIDEDVLTFISVSDILITILFCFLIMVAEAGGFGVDIPDALKKDEKKLGKDFDDLLKQAGHKGDNNG